MLRTNGFAQQHGTGSPFTTESDAHQAAGDEQLLKVLCKTGEEGEQRKPSDRYLQRPHTADAIGQPTGTPATQGGHQQRDGRQLPRLTAADTPDANQGRDDKAVQLNIHTVQRPTGHTSLERAAFSATQFAVPGRPPTGLTHLARFKSDSATSASAAIRAMCSLAMCKAFK